MEPVVSNSFSNNCSDPISSNCVISQVSLQMMPCLNLCGQQTVTQVENAIGSLLCAVVQQFTLTEAQYQSLLVNTNLTPPIDFSGLNLSCLYQATITTCNCPTGWTYIPDPTGVTIGTCSNGCIPGSKRVGTNPDGSALCEVCFNIPCPPPIPICTTSANPTPPPSSLVGILQLIINKSCNCCP